ncbi:MAG: hypothetical protein NTW68_05330 [candidate division NC10 bacterium]|nr:hypothetical protein [candidate division NC10 bacterium]
MKTAKAAKPAPKDKPKTAGPTMYSKPSPLDLVSSRASMLSMGHEDLESLSLALDEIEFQYASFSTDKVRDYARAAIVEKLDVVCKRQREDFDELFLCIKALGPEQAKKGGAR